MPAMRLIALLLAAAALAGCGGDGEPDPERGGGPLLVGLGDSITEGVPYRTEDSWLAEAGRRHRIRTRNCGVAGERIEQIAQRLDRCARGATVLVLQGGTNDLAQGRTGAQVAADLRALALRARRTGAAVHVTEVLPWLAGYPSAAPHIVEANRRIRALEREGVTVIRWAHVLEDPRRPGRMLPEHTADGDHPDERAHRLLGRAVRLRGVR
jgi:lysophospholipase L1-like esterase